MSHFSNLQLKVGSSGLCQHRNWHNNGGGIYINLLEKSPLNLLEKIPVNLLEKFPVNLSKMGVEIPSQFPRNSVRRISQFSSALPNKCRPTASAA